MMPGKPLPSYVARLYLAVQCVCGMAMHYGQDNEDLCKHGQITCQNSSCRNFMKPFVAPTVDVKRARPS